MTAQNANALCGAHAGDNPCYVFSNLTLTLPMDTPANQPRFVSWYNDISELTYGYVGNQESSSNAND